MEPIKYFHAIDFVILCGTFFSSASIGIYFAYKGWGTESTESYYFGNRKLSPLPVSISLCVSFVSAITVVGVPAEVYYYGTVYLWVLFGQSIGFIVTAVYYIPLYYKLRLSSVYEYLALRFHIRLRSLASTAGIVNQILYMGCAVYIPSLAVSAVTPLSLNWSIALTSIICTFYTSIGGIKAVIWTDVLQCFVMVTGMLSVLIRGLVVVGGFGEVSAAMERGQRNNFIKFDPDPRIRSTTWAVFIGAFVNSTFKACCDQVNIQRYMACDSIRSARIAAVTKIIPMTLFGLISCLTGMVMYAYFEGCDPVMAGVITKVDQAVPRLAMEVFQEIPGMAGLFVAAAYSGTLSTISSGVNSISALTMEDFILKRYPAMRTRTKVVVSKTLVAAFGMIVMSLAYLISVVSANIIQITVSMIGAMGAPILAIYIMGAFMPWIGSMGALIGLITGWICTGAVAISALFVERYPFGSAKLPLTISNCTESLSTTSTPFSTSYTLNLTMEPATFVHTEMDDQFSINYTFLSMSPYLYGLFGFFVTTLTAHFCCIVSGFEKPSKANPDLFVPIFDSFRCGVPVGEDTPKGDSEELKPLPVSE